VHEAAKVNEHGLLASGRGMANARYSFISCSMRSLSHCFIMLW
jgi:hypothetical protein